ncbi:MAG: hypothetical protein U1F37_21670 [Alphaproteobacteria bacterium]
MTLCPGRRAGARGGARRPDRGLARGWRCRGAALLFGALAAAALPPVHALPLLLIAFPGLILLLRGTRTVWNGFWAGWWFGCGFFIGGIYCSPGRSRSTSSASGG